MMARRERITKLSAKNETRFIIAMAIIIALLIALALYGYYTGAWEPPPAT